MNVEFETFGPGRPLLPETQKKLRSMLSHIQKEPGIRSAKLARLLKVSSQECANLSRKLEHRGLIRVESSAGARQYYLTEAANG
jgi:Mn-dependent DtxR family transcriptional regulator